jgi:hypothetical protein
MMNRVRCLLLRGCSLEHTIVVLVLLAAAAKALAQAPPDSPIAGLVQRIGEAMGYPGRCASPDKLCRSFTIVDAQGRLDWRCFHLIGTRDLAMTEDLFDKP